MIKGKTSTGFEFEYSEKKMNDWEYMTNYASMMEALNVLQEDAGDVSAVSAAIRSMNGIVDFLLGKNASVRLRNHLRKVNDGVAGTKEMLKEINEIVLASKDKSGEDEGTETKN